jgi:hypothetical protein
VMGWSSIWYGSTVKLPQSWLTSKENAPLLNYTAVVTASALEAVSVRAARAVPSTPLKSLG